MVSVRGAHLNENEAFNLAAWITSLTLPNETSAEKLTEVCRYCEQKDAQTPDLHLLRSGVEIVEILTTLNMDIESLCAGLLYPFVQHQRITDEEITESFGANIAQLIRVVITMEGIRQLQATQNSTATSEQVDNVRRMLLAMVEDFRCVVIKLAERITFLRGIGSGSEEDRVLAANECANIYAPLANRLGIGQLKWELEDFCFRYQHPDKYREIANLLHEKRLDREKYVENFVTQLKKAILKEGITAEVYGRPKHIYSIWRKLQKKHLSFDELYDVRAVRIIVERLQDCYAALGIAHTHFRHLPSEFDDYIANPKPNGYQSIHTVVFGPQGKVIEIQIRTRQMHEDAELGVAAHWKYKEDGKSGGKAYDDRIAWLRKLLAWQEEIADSGEVLDEVRSQVFDDRVYVFTPKGDVIDLPTGSTPLDFAYHIHSDVGHRCIGAKVGGRIVPFTYQLQMGDQVEIITQKFPNPSRDWLNPSLGFVNSSRSRSKIQAWFKKQDREKNCIAGRQILDEGLESLDLLTKDVEKLLVKRYNAHSFDEVLAGIGGGDIRINQLINYLRATLIKPSAEEEDEAALKQLQQKNASSASRHDKQKGQIVIDGIGNLLHHLAKCCNPIPGEDIIGFITQGRGVSVHRCDCEQLLDLRQIAPERIVEAAWSDYNTTGFSFRTVLRIIANDRSGLLRDITTILANEKVNVLSVSTRTDTKQQIATMDMEIEVFNQDALHRVLTKLDQLIDVISAKRVQG